MVDYNEDNNIYRFSFKVLEPKEDLVLDTLVLPNDPYSTLSIEANDIHVCSLIGIGFFDGAIKTACTPLHGDLILSLVKASIAYQMGDNVLPMRFMREYTSSYRNIEEQDLGEHLEWLVRTLSMITPEEINMLVRVFTISGYHQEATALQHFYASRKYRTIRSIYVFEESK